MVVMDDEYEARMMESSERARARLERERERKKAEVRGNRASTPVTRSPKVGGAAKTLPPARARISPEREKEQAYWRARFDRIVEVCQNRVGKSRHIAILSNYILDDIIEEMTASMWTYKAVVLKCDSVFEDVCNEIREMKKEKP